MMGSATLQGHLWGGAAHTWADLQEPLSVPVWQAMLDVAGVGPGTRLLDAACGASTGPVQAAVRLLGQLPVRTVVQRVLTSFATVEGVVPRVTHFRHIVATHTQ